MKIIYVLIKLLQKLAFSMDWVDILIDKHTSIMKFEIVSLLISIHYTDSNLESHILTMILAIWNTRMFSSPSNFSG